MNEARSVRHFPYRTLPKEKDLIIQERCDLCQWNKPARQKTRTALKPITIMGLFHRVGVDCMIPTTTISSFPSTM
uniref:Uncharacterized protein n=1 Tax=Romanomermis culicivorax TaxID=13658 RepID=A0A915JPS9_ROMCU